jgi:hypothetical protein
MSIPSTIIFLDFDGVLRRISSDPSVFEPSLLTTFEAALKPFNNISIVITSTWRLVIPLSEIKGLFSKSTADYIIGVTPELHNDTSYPRYEEILSYLKINKLEKQNWVAIDDDRDNFPTNSPVIYTDPNIGFSEHEVVKLWECLSMPQR